jgi:hypothetical protein
VSAPRLTGLDAAAERSGAVRRRPAAIAVVSAFAGDAIPIVEVHPRIGFVGRLRVILRGALPAVAIPLGSSSDREGEERERGGQHHGAEPGPGVFLVVAYPGVSGDHWVNVSTPSRKEGS